MTEHELLGSPAMLAVAAAGGWGFWALFTKLATRSAEPEVVLVVSYLVASTLGIGYFLATPGGLDIATRDLGFAVAAGVATGVGSILYYTSLKHGDIGRVTTITGLYFVFSAILGVTLLREPVTARKVIGVVLGAVAIAILAR